jgi:hypothetical protein
VVAQNDFSRATTVPLAQVRLEPALPVAVPNARRARRDDEIAWDEEVVRDRVRGEMREIAEREALDGIVPRLIVDLEADRP